MLSRGTARPVLAVAILAFCPRLVFPPRPRAPSLAAARSLPPAFPTGPLPPNRVGEGSLRRRRAVGSPAPRRSEVRIVPLLFNFWFLGGGICRCRAESFPGIEAAFVSIACPDGWNRRKLAGCCAVSLDACRVRCGAAPELEKKTVDFFSTHRFPNSDHLGRTDCCCLPLESSNRRILFRPSCIEFPTFAIEPGAKCSNATGCLR